MGCSPSVQQKSHINQSDLPQSCSPRKKNKVCDLSMILKNNRENQKSSQIIDQQDNSPRKQKFYFKNAKQQIVSLEYQSSQTIQNWAKQLEKNQQKNTFTSLNTNSTAPSKDQIPSLIMEEQLLKQNQNLNQQQLGQHKKQQIQCFISDNQNLIQQINTNQNEIQSKNGINNNNENNNQEITIRNKKCTLGHLDQQFIQSPQQQIQQVQNNPQIQDQELKKKSQNLVFKNLNLIKAQSSSSQYENSLNFDHKCLNQKKISSYDEITVINDFYSNQSSPGQKKQKKGSLDYPLTDYKKNKKHKKSVFALERDNIKSNDNNQNNISNDKAKLNNFIQQNDSENQLELFQSNNEQNDSNINDKQNNQFLQQQKKKLNRLSIKRISNKKSIYDLKVILQQNNNTNNDEYAQQNNEENQRQKNISNFYSPQKQQKEEQQLELEQKLAEIIDFDSDDIDINRYQQIQQNSINISQLFKKKSIKQLQSEQKIGDQYEQQHFSQKCKSSQFYGFDSQQLQQAFQKAGKKMQKKKYQVQLQFIQDKVSVLRDMVGQGYQIEDISISQQIKNNIKHSYIIKKRKLAKKYLNKMENQV